MISLGWNLIYHSILTYALGRFIVQVIFFILGRYTV